MQFPGVLNALHSTTYLLLGLAVGAVTPEALAAQDDSQAYRLTQFNPSFTNGRNGDALDISRFAYGNWLTPGDYRLDVYVNDSWIGRLAVKVLPGPQNQPPRYCFARDELPLLGVDVHKLPHPTQAESLIAAQSCVVLNDLVPQSRVEVDVSELRATISLPQAYLSRSLRGSVDPSQWDRGINAAFLSYNANAYQGEYQGQAQDQQYLGLNAGLNLGDWRLRHNASYNRTSGDDQETHSEYDSISSYAQRDITPLKAQLTLGEYYTPNDLFDSVPFTGAQLASDDRMLPDAQRGFAPVIRGMAETNARVTVRQGDNVIYEANVTPGPFSIDDLYNTGYAGDLQVTVTEADGRSKSFLVPYASVAQLLRPGVSRFSLSAGEYRDDYLDDLPRFVQATYQRGLSNLITAYTGGIVAEQYLSGQGGLAFSTPYGALAADVTLSQASDMPGTSEGIDERMNGQSYRITYSKLLDATATNFTIAAYRFSSDGYLSFADYAQLRGSDSPNLYRERNRFQLNLQQPLGGSRGSIYLSGSARNYWDAEQDSDMTYQAGYSNSYHWGSLGLSASRTRNSEGDFDTQYMLTFSIPLGHGRHSPYLSSSLNYSDGSTHNLQTNLSGSAGDNDQYSYNLYGSASQADNDKSSNSGVAGEYRSSVAVLGAGLSSGDGFKQANLSARGSLIAHSGGVLAAQDQGETMAIIHADGAQGAAVSNNSGVTLDNDGYAVVSGLIPYRNNEVDLDPKGTSEDVELQGTSQLVAPKYGAIVRLDYPTLKGHPLLMHILREGDRPVPIGAEVLDMQGNPLGLVGQGSRAFLRGLEPQGSLRVRWGKGRDQQCQLNYRLPAAMPSSQSLQKLESRCEPPLPKGERWLSGN